MKYLKTVFRSNDFYFVHFGGQMKKRRLLYLTCPVVVFIIACCSCTVNSRKDAVTPVNGQPFDYRIPNTYVYTVKATGGNMQLLYQDTLGLMCSDRPTSFAPRMGVSSWVYLTMLGGDYKFSPARNSNTYSGTLSNNDSLFIHPPREEQYRILQICPYPFLTFPLSVGRTWDYDLVVGQQWCPNNNIRWQGDEHFLSHYRVIDTAFMKIIAGKELCYHIQAIGISKLGSSVADFYYSYKNGFVKLVYHPLDSSTIEFRLLPSANASAVLEAMLPGYRSENEPWNVNGK